MTKFVSPNQSNSILQKLNGDRRCDKTTCDIQLKCDGRIFNAHKIVLSMVSDYFKKLFYTEMKEKYQDTVAVKEIDSGVFEKVLDFVYTAEITIDSNTAFDLLNAANYLLIKDLLNFCCTFLLETLDCNNAVQYWKTGKILGIKTLANPAQQFITDNFAMLTDVEAINAMDRITFEEFLRYKSKDREGEETAFQFTVDWVEHDLEARKHLFPQLFELIDLKLINFDFFCFNLACEECLLRLAKHMKHLHGPRPEYSILIMNENSTILKMLDVNANVEKEITILNEPRRQASFAVYKNYLFMIGGSSDEENRTDSVFRLDVRSPNKGWEKQSSSPLKRRNAGMAVLLNEAELFVFGGYSRDDGSRLWTTPNKLKLDEEGSEWIRMEDCKGSLDLVACKDTLYAMHYGQHTCERYDPFTETSTVMHKLPKGCAKLVAMEGQLYAICKAKKKLTLKKYEPESGVSSDVTEKDDVEKFRDACIAHGEFVVSYESHQMVKVCSYNFEKKEWRFIAESDDLSNYWNLIPLHSNPFDY